MCTSTGRHKTYTQLLLLSRERGKKLCKIHSSSGVIIKVIMCIHFGVLQIFFAIAVVAAATATVSIAIVIIAVVALFKFISAMRVHLFWVAIVYSVHVFGIQLTTGMMANKWTHSKYILGRLAFCMWQ